MTGTANGAPSAESAFQPSPAQQQLLQQARAHAASLALQNTQRRDAAASNAVPSAAAASKLQQRAAAAAQALGADRRVSAREIQAMLEKNEAALRMWNTLHRQQPSVQQQVDHKEWLKKCYLYRQQIGARLEVLASLADKQIAQEDAKGQTIKKSPASTPPSTVHSVGMSNPQATIKSSHSIKTAPVAARTPVTAPQAVPSPFPTAQVGPTNSVQTQSMSAFGSIGTTASTSSAMPSSAMTSMGMTPAMAGSSAGSSAMSAPMSGPMSAPLTSAFDPTAFNSTSSAMVNAYMNQAPNYMMNPAMMAMNAMGAAGGNGMMNPQQFMMMQMQMPMGMNMAAAGMYGQPNMFANVNYGMGTGGTNPLPMDPFNASLSGFGQPGMGFPNAQANMGGSAVGYGMPNNMQAAQMMNPMAGGYPSMMPNNFQFGGGSATAAGMTPVTQGMPDQQLQQQQQGSQMYHTATSAGLYQQQAQPQPQQQTQSQPRNQPQPQDSNASRLLPDPDLFGDDDMAVNLFEGFSDDAFLPLQ